MEWFGKLGGFGLVSSLLCGAPSALAGELLLGATGEYDYVSNFFASPDDPEDASAFFFGPTVGLVHEHGRFTHDLDFSGAYQTYVDLDGVDAWESRLRARTSIALDSRTTLRITDRFRDVSNLRFSRDDIVLADTALDPNQNRYFRNSLDLELIRALSRKLEWSARGSHHWIDFVENVDRNDSQAFEGASELRYQVAEQHRLGVGASYLHQEFDDALSRLGSTNDSVTAFASWSWNLLDQVVFSASAGPAWIHSSPDESASVLQREFVGLRQGDEFLRAAIASCDVDPRLGDRVASRCDFGTAPIAAGDLGARQRFALVGGEGQDDRDVVTGFGSASLRATPEDWNLQATYARQQNTTSGGGLASSLDRVYAEAEFAPENQRWSAFVAGSWDRRETLTRAAVVDFVVVDDGAGAARRDSAFTRSDRQAERRENLTAITGIRTRLTRNQAATIEFRYRRTEGRNQGVEQPAADSYIGVVTFAYTLDPIEF